MGLLPQTPPQGLHAGLVPGGTSTIAPRVEFPERPGLTRTAPFVDLAGQPVPTDAAAAGAADFDGDGTQDLWFLSTSGTNAGELSVVMARASSLLRYRGWHTYAPRTWEHGATFRSKEYTSDRVLLVDRLSPQLLNAHYTYPFGSATPQVSGSFNVNSSWTVGLGAYEIATRDDDGDGNDDIAVLIEPQPGWTRIKKLRMGSSLGWFHPEKEVVCDIPIAAHSIKMLDVDNDGLSDVLVRLGETGVLLLIDDGARFVPTTLLLLPMPAADVFVGDADGNEFDDFGMVFATGVFLARADLQRLDPVWLQAPSGVGPLASAGVVGDLTGALTTVAAFPADGQSVAVFPYVGYGLFGGAEVLAPPTATEYQGSGADGVPAIIADMDGDDDEDIVLPLADRQHWLVLQNSERSHAPTTAQLIDFGHVGETGYRKYGVIADVPDQALQAGLSTIELAVFLEDVNAQPPVHVYWGRLLGQVDPTSGTVGFTIYSQTQKNKIPAMLANREVHYPPQQPDGITTGGQSLISIHFKDGTRRFGSMLIHHDPDEGNKSAVGPKWQATTAPPDPAMDRDLLPWN